MFPSQFIDQHSHCPIQNKKIAPNNTESVIPDSNGLVTTTIIHDRRSSDDMEECHDMQSEGSVSSPTPLVVVSEESKYASVEAVRGPRPPPRLDQRVEYEMIDLKATKVS